MARVNTTITLDYETHKAVKKLEINISRVCNKALDKEIKKMEKV